MICINRTSENFSLTLTVEPGLLDQEESGPVHQICFTSKQRTIIQKKNQRGVAGMTKHR